MSRVVLLGVLGACASVPPGPKEITADIVHVTDSLDITVSATHYEMKFPVRDTDVVRMPMSLTVRNSMQDNLLGDDSECNKESRIGAGIYPAGIAIAGRPAPRSDVTHSDANVRLTGPAVAKVEVDTVIPIACGAEQDVFAVNAVFTFFPDGRITREERVKSSEGMLTGNMCGCGNVTGSDWYLTSWYAFEQGTMMVDRNGVVQGPSTTLGDDDACATWSDATLAMHFSGTTTRITPNMAPSFVLDMVYSNGSSFPSTTRTNTSTMMVLPASTPPPQCRDALDRIALPQIEIAETPTIVSPDGVYRDMTPHTQTFDINPVGGVAVQPFAVALAIGDHAEITSTKYGSNENWYVPQYQSDDEVYLWFPNGLQSDEQITIAPK